MNNKPSNKKMNGLKKFLNDYNILLSIVGLIGILISFHIYVNNIIITTINDPDVIKQISLRLRPFLIFDTNKTIKYDNGAYDKYIEDISFETTPEGETIKIIIKTKAYLQTAPILDCLTYNCYAESQRGPNNSWEYKLISESCLLLERSADIPEHVYRLEIIN